MEISDVQSRRAVNIIWNAARNYTFTPDFKAYDDAGKADLYWNCIIGAVRRHYEYPKLEKIFLNFQQYEDADVYEGLLWLGLENCVFAKESPTRPALASLREEYARGVLRSCRAADYERFYETMAIGHYSRVLGIEPKLDAYNLQLLDELEFSPALTTDEIAARAETLFAKWFRISAEEKKKFKHRSPPALFARKNVGRGKARYRKFFMGFADHPKNIYGGSAAGGQDAQKKELTALSDSDLRAFMETKYGKPLYSPSQTAEIERALCCGNHENCHLLFTRGEPSKKLGIQNGFEALQKEREAKQIQQNRACYRQNLARNRITIEKLTGMIQNSVLLHLQPSPVKANYGTLCGGKVWRAVHLNDDKVFIHDEQSNMGDLSVDILLDASTSQKNRQETVSSQGFMIAESLAKCGIPCRVMSFCSMTGYTILRVFRDYAENRKNDAVFDYVSNGCNRDGLAVRAAGYLMAQSRCEHRILIILSDVKPNDVRKIRGTGEDEFIPYETDAGVTDTAFEVRRLRADGIAVVCVFTGDDEDIPAAKKVYGRDFARIHSLDQLADTVGALIQNQIKNL